MVIQRYLHVLKIEQTWYDRIACGAKTHEVRRHDRDFQVGDWIGFDILDDTVDQFRQRRWEITHVLPLRQVPGLHAEGPWCVLSLREVEPQEWAS